MLFLSYKIEYLNLHFLPNCFIFVLNIIDIYINKSIRWQTIYRIIDALSKFNEDLDWDQFHNSNCSSMFIKPKNNLETVYFHIIFATIIIAIKQQNKHNNEGCIT